MKKTCALMAVAALAACAQAAHAQAAPAAPAPATLRLKFTPGQTLYYKITMHIGATLMDGRPGPTRHYWTQTEMLMHQAVKSVRDSDGAATIEVIVDSTHTVGGTVPAPEDGTQPKTLGTMVVLPTGKVLSYRPGAGGALTIGISGLSSVPENPSGILCQFPAAPVAVGSTWEGVTSIPALGPEALGFTLSGFDRVGGKTVARIGLTGHGSSDTAATVGPGGLRVKEMVNQSGVFHFDADAGAVEDQATHSVLRLITVPPRPSARTQMMTGIDTTLTRVFPTSGKN